MLFEIHMLKNYPPTNLNRDETGSPKSCYFGGTQRGRISSQCLKRTWRTSPLFSQLLGEQGIRTRKLPELVAEELRNRGMTSDLVDIFQSKISGFANKDSKENKDLITSQIIFFSKKDITIIADQMEKLALLEPTDGQTSGIAPSQKSAKLIKEMKAADIEKLIKDGNTRPITMDIALFGRMVTSDVFNDVEAAVQTAHAFSTHPVNQESDYFTAVDDMISATKSDDKGAAMIGDIDYNACCYYHYISIDTDQLEVNLRHSPDAKALIKQVLPAFLQLMAFSDPTGKQNTFAGHVLPELLCVEIKEKKIPVSYANAFAEPVRFTGQHQLVHESQKKLIEEINAVDKAYDLEIKHRAWFSLHGSQFAPEKAQRMATFRELLESCQKWIDN